MTTILETTRTLGAEEARIIGFAAAPRSKRGHRWLPTLPKRHRLWAVAVARRSTVQ